MKARNLQSFSLDPCSLWGTSGLSSDLLFDSDVILLLSTGNLQRAWLFFLVGLAFCDRRDLGNRAENFPYDHFSTGITGTK